MKKIITLLLIVTIQMTFVQKAIASVPLLKSDGQSMMVHCELEMPSDSTDCMTSMTKAMSMDNCQNDCDMMTVVSILHFIENDNQLSFNCTQLSYPIYNKTAAIFFLKSIYRPPLFS